MKVAFSCMALFVLIIFTLPGHTAERHNPVPAPEGWNPALGAEYLVFIKRFHDTETVLRERHRSSEERKNAAAETLAWIQNKVESRDVIASSPIKSYRLRLMCLLSNETDEKLVIARKLMNNVLWTPGILMSFPFFRNGPSREEHNLYMKTLAALLPLSYPRRWTDSHNRVTGDISVMTKVPAVPLLIQDYMVQIGELWEKNGFYDEASLAYREAIYGNARPRRLHLLEIRSSWLGEYYSEVWLRIAHCELRMGRYHNAADAASIAMIYGDRQHFEQGKDFIEIMLIDIDEDPKNVDNPSLERSTLLEIVRLYCRLNAHPRAFWVLEKYRDVVGPDFDQTWNVVAEEWLAICRRTLSQYPALPKNKGRVFLYGHNIVPEEERLDVRVPPLFYGDSLQRAVEMFEEFIASQGL